MKAILVIDTPKECYYCKLMTNDMYCKGFTPYYAEDGTHITKMCVEDYVMRGTKHPNCPLKPMPEKKVGDDLYERYGSWTIGDEKELSYRVGFNDCIDEILGEQ